MLQENHYAPWGLSLAGFDYSSPGLKALNQYPYNDKEKQPELGWAMYSSAGTYIPLNEEVFS